MSMTDPRTAPFAARPCACCKGHTPVPLETEGHHTFPQVNQRAIWGEVRDTSLVFLCRTAHRNLHIYLDALLAGRPTPAVNAHTRAVAREGYRRILAAREGTR